MICLILPNITECYLKQVSDDKNSCLILLNNPIIFVQLGPKLNTKLALDHPPPPPIHHHPPTRNFSKGSRHSRGLKFGMTAYIRPGNCCPYTPTPTPTQNITLNPILDGYFSQKLSLLLFVIISSICVRTHKFFECFKAQ